MRYFMLPNSVLCAVIRVLITGTNTVFWTSSSFNNSVDMQVCLAWILGNATAFTDRLRSGIMSVKTDSESR